MTGLEMHICGNLNQLRIYEKWGRLLNEGPQYWGFIVHDSKREDLKPSSKTEEENHKDGLWQLRGKRTSTDGKSPSVDAAPEVKCNEP